MNAVTSPAPVVAVAAPMARAYYPGLQAIRGAACLGVFFMHAYGMVNAFAPGPSAALDAYNTGGTGIMLFFALSAFIMLERAGDSFGTFVLDRLRRIFPLLWISLVAAGAMSTYVYGASGLRWTTWLLIPTTVPAYVPVPFWSLSFELFFYLLVAFAGLWGYRSVVTIVLLWCVVGMGFHQAPYHAINHALYPQVYPFFVTVFGYFFAAGILARIGFDPRSKLRWVYAAGAVGMYVVVYWHLIPSWVYTTVPVDRHPSMIFALLAVGCFLAMRAGALWTPKSWPSRMLVKIGDYSYGIYLMHMAAMMMVIHWIQPLNLGLGFWSATLLVMVAAGVPSVLWGVFDLWMQRALKRRSARRRRDDDRQNVVVPAPLSAEGTAPLA